MPLTLPEAITKVHDELEEEARACEPNSFAARTTVFETARYDEIAFGDEQVGVSLLIWDIPDTATPDTYSGFKIPESLLGKKVALYYFTEGYLDNAPYFAHSEPGFADGMNQYRMLVEGLAVHKLTARKVLEFNELQWPAMANGEPYDKEEHEKRKTLADWATKVKDYITGENEANLAVSEEESNKIGYDFRGKRYKGTLASWIAKRSPWKAMPDATKELIMNRVNKYTFDVSKAISVVHGEAICKAYEDRIGGSSCMAGKGNTLMLDLYRKCPEDIGLAILRTPDKTGRAILWLNATKRNGEKVVAVDRVYPAGDHQIFEYFEAWAKQNGYIIRSRSEDTFPEKLSVTIKADKVLAYPYLDSFYRCNYTEDKEGGLTLQLDSYEYPNGERNRVTLTNQHGGGPLTNACPECGERSRIQYETMSGAAYCPLCVDRMSAKAFNPLRT